MHLTFAPNDILQIDGARLIFRNFSGTPSKFNREGDRNFAFVITEKDIADALIERGWNVKIKAPREVGDEPFMYMSVKVKFNDFGPNVYLKTGNKMNRLNADSIGCLDNINIVNADFDLRPYDWEMNGKEGRSAYLMNMRVTQELDRFAEEYDEDMHPIVKFPRENDDELPF